MTLDHDTPARVLAIYAHPDDPEISSGGTLARWASAGSEVHILTTTRGDKGTSDPNADTVELARVRVDESAAAARVLGVAGVHHLDYPDGDLDDDRSLRADLVRYIRRLRPDVVLGPDPTAVFFADSYVNHRDHRVTGWAVLDAASPAAGNPHYFPELRAEGLDIHQPRALYLSGTFEPNVWIDVTATIDRKIEALFCHASQLADTTERFRDFLRETAEAAGRAAGVSYAEGFRRIVLA